MGLFDIFRRRDARMEYNLLPGELFDRLYNGERKGCTPDELAEAEKKLGVKLPGQLRDFYFNYSGLELSSCLEYILPVGRADFTYNWLDLEKEDWEEEKGMPVEEIKKTTRNFFIFWSENQGVWSAAILDEDMHRENPPVYMNSDESIFEWYVASNSFDSFILSMIWDNATDCPGFVFRESYDEKEILQVIKRNGIDKARLTPTYNKHTATCWDNKLKRLYMFINRNGEGTFSEMRVLTV